MSKSKNSHRGIYPRIRRTDPWDLENRITKTDNKKELKRLAIETELLCYHNLSTFLSYPAPKREDWSKRL